ncbi:MAG: ATP-binding cassette domain-containing protein [Coriobacteriia bacterium]|nr:ATP-binding cassette domain-containing protein [Coriobacteriia bacterium]
MPSDNQQVKRTPTKVPTKAPAKTSAKAPAKATASAPAKTPTKVAASAPAKTPAKKRTPKSNEDVVIEFRHVTKTYHLYKSDQGRFLGLFNYKKKSSYLGSTNANNDLSFKIRRGETVAFLGFNGAGKSTTLKIVTGVTKPTSGKVIVKGKVSALLEVNAGFDRKLTGRENIHLRGQALGYTRKEIMKLEPKVVEFAELGPYIDQPIRTYSSGMKSRLGFAFAVSVDPEILIVDEALSVGDKRFKEKCITRIKEIMSQEHVTVLFVSHTSATAREFCKRGIVLDKGVKIFDGAISRAISVYNALDA